MEAGGHPVSPADMQNDQPDSPNETLSNLELHRLFQGMTTENNRLSTRPMQPVGYQQGLRLALARSVFLLDFFLLLGSRL